MNRSVSLEDLETIRNDLIYRVRNSLTNQDKEFLLSVKYGEPRWDLHPCPHIEKPPVVRWKLQSILKMNKNKRGEAYDKLKSILYEAVV
jgi:hypothetical protein